MTTQPIPADKNDLRIYKFAVRVTDFDTLTAPEGAEFLPGCRMVPNTFDAIEFFALVDTTSALIKYDVAVVGTGHRATHLANENLNYLGTAFDHKIGAVWHCFIGMQSFVYGPPIMIAQFEAPEPATEFIHEIDAWKGGK